MRVLAQFSGDEKLISMFLNKEDVHGSTAVTMFELDCESTEVKKKYPHLRQASKILNFLLAYGGSARTLYENLRDDHFSPIDLSDKEYLQEYNCRNGEQVAQKYIDKYFDGYKGVAEFMRRQRKIGRRNGYVMSMWGRKRRLQDYFKSRKLEYKGERLTVNSVIQGSASDIVESAQIRMHYDERLEELECFMLVQIHDEVLFECPEENIEEASALIKYHMENMFGDKTSKLVIPFTAEIGTGWSYQEAK